MITFHTNGTSTPPAKPEPDQRPTAPVELHSEEVQEILGQIPGWTIRWGITVIFSIVTMLLLASWFIKYPDTIQSRVVLTTQTPPASLIARSDGPLKLFVRDHQSVQRGEYLAMLENPTRIEDFRYVSDQVASFRTLLYQVNQELDQVSFRENLTLGELQPSYVAFLSSLQDYRRTRGLLSHDKQIAGLNRRIQQYEQLNQQLEKQQQLLAQELELAQKRFAMDKQLFSEEVIAEADFDKTKSLYLQSKRTFESAQGNIISNQIIISQLRAQVTELETDKADTEGRLKNNIESAFKALESQLDSWKQRYLLQTPIAGKVAFVNYRSDNQFVRTGEEVLTVVPESGELYGQVQMPIAGSGKVAVGQRVNIRFDNYPATEYGMVTGRIAAISPVPRDGQYLIQIELPEGLTTSYRKQLVFKQEMQGNAEIITKDLRLLERVFHHLRALLDKASQ